MMSTTWRRSAAAALLSTLALSGCAGLISRAGNGVSRDLSAGILEQDDPQLVGEGLPAFVLLLEGLLRSNPDDAALLMSTSRLYGAYAGVFATEPARRARLANKALDYARRATCASDAALCEALEGPYEPFAARVGAADARQVDLLYGLATAWAGVIQAQSDDFDRIAELPKVEALLDRVVAIDPDHDGGSAWMYLGVLRSLRPEALGGQPAQGRASFEQAITRSNKRNLMAQVLYAEYYARLMFDQDLHDRLLGEVLAAEVKASGLTLSNVLAQRRARELLESGKDYF
jgi:hypothetical protein